MPVLVVDSFRVVENFHRAVAPEPQARQVEEGAGCPEVVVGCFVLVEIVLHQLRKLACSVIKQFLKSFGIVAVESFDYLKAVDDYLFALLKEVLALNSSPRTENVEQNGLALLIENLAVIELAAHVVVDYSSSAPVISNNSCDALFDY